MTTEMTTEQLRAQAIATKLLVGSLGASHVEYLARVLEAHQWSNAACVFFMVGTRFYEDYEIEIVRNGRMVLYEGANHRTGNYPRTLMFRGFAIQYAPELNPLDVVLIVKEKESQ